MVNVKLNAATVETRSKLLEAAGEVFADVGYRNATVRQICERAGVNNAAINYHFGDKEELYVEVLRYTHCAAQAENELRARLSANMPVEQRLATFVHGFMLHLLDNTRPAWHAQLMAREMADPTAALEAIVRESIRPMNVELEGIIRELLGPVAEPLTVRLSVGSVMGQCLLYKHCKPVINKLYPEQKFEPAAIAEIAQHIAEFSLCAIRTMRAKKESGPR